ncbi:MULTISPECIES: L,D-transpeptidase [unclassified Thioalkalivibrio]|uniref:L,D-transpeptidase n=1 Tax=unclassified Thioalkalivibrio TaxID=2621013 RepID=UPI0003A8574D|nr:MULTISPECIES: L,D-transpeptidase [unclassified Thioalkalivibrio]
MTLPSLQWIEPVIEAARKQAGGGAATLPTVVVRVDQQRLYVWEGGKVTDVFDVSTSERGIGNQDGTYKTPLGLHRIAERFGDGAAPGTVFRARANTGEIAEILTGEGERSRRDNITSRILWLEGLEPGLNRGGSIDSYQRYIYIHGTDEEGRIGEPASEGCVRMRNDEVIELFPRLPVGTLVVILNGPDYEAGRVLPV